MQDLPKQPLYRVTFYQQHVWEGYTGTPEDTIDVEVYQAWLKPASTSQLEQQNQHRHEHHAHQHSDDHGHHGQADQHGDPQAIDHGDHTHEGRTAVEQNAIDLEGQDDAERSCLSEALVKVRCPSSRRTQATLCCGRSKLYQATKLLSPYAVLERTLSATSDHEASFTIHASLGVSWCRSFTVNHSMYKLMQIWLTNCEINAGVPREEHYLCRCSQEDCRGSGCTRREETRPYDCCQSMDRSCLQS